MKLTIESLLNWINTNKIPMDTEIFAAGAPVRFIGYDARPECGLSIDDEVQDESEFDIIEILW